MRIIEYVIIQMFILILFAPFAYFFFEDVVFEIVISSIIGIFFGMICYGAVKSLREDYEWRKRHGFNA